jgi:hypothetical protein
LKWPRPAVEADRRAPEACSAKRPESIVSRQAADALANPFLSPVDCEK